MNSILQTTREELKIFLRDHSLPAYRADQILSWVYKHRATDWQQTTNLPAELQQFLSEHYSLRQGRLEKKQSSADDTIKILLRWPDDAQTETVLIADDRRRTVCLSTKICCPVECAFCASGLTALERSLAAAEDVLVIGAPADDEVTWGAGAVYVYRFVEGAWNLEAKLISRSFPYNLFPKW